MTTPTTTSPAALRAQAAAARQAAEDSFDRCDTDGFLSQWAHGITARKLDAEAALAEAGGMIVALALFDRDGELVPAKYVPTRYGSAWGLLESPDPHAPFTGYFNPSRSMVGERRYVTDYRRGYTVGEVRVPGRVVIAGSGTGMSGCATAHVVTERADHGYTPDAEVVTTRSARWYENHC